MSKSPESKPSSTPMPWVRPRIRVGDTVLWSKNPDSERAVCIVTSVDDLTINCSAFHPDSKILQPKEAVRHVDDPALKTQSFPDGVWRYTDATADFYRMLEAFDSNSILDGV